jgi:hypothetical protein
MCGIYGAVVVQPGAQWDLGIIRALTWANRERGTDSLGFFDSTGKMTKGSGDPAEVLRKKRVKKWLKNSRDTGSWFVAGHTRFATRGKVNRRNAHPFRYGRIIGSHNGMCDAPRKFQVDSEFLFFSLNKARGDYQKGLEDISGYFGLSWYDGQHFYLMQHSGELAYVVLDGVLYYSSGWSHLDSCTGGDSSVLKEGQVLRIGPDGDIANSKDEDSPVKTFVSKACTYGYGGWIEDDDGTYVRSGGSRYRNVGRGCGTYQVPTASNDIDNVRDYDSEWMEAWSEYCTDAEHSKID